MPSFYYFDIGAVLLAFDNERMVRQMAAVAGVDPRAMAEAVFAGEGRETAQWRLEAGALSEDEYYEHVCAALGSRPPRAELELAASDIFEPIEGTMRIAERLRAAGCRLGLLSNTNGVHWRFFMDGRYPTLREAFEVGVGSFEARAMKPDPAIYRVAAERAGVAPGEIFFTDDREENVAGAIAFGFDAVRFTGPETLEAELRSRGAPLG